MKDIKKLISKWQKELDVVKIRLEDTHITKTYRHRLMGEKKVLDQCLKDVSKMIYNDSIKNHKDCLCTFEILETGDIIKTSECNFHKLDQ